jgi:hypothetical protein
MTENRKIEDSGGANADPWFSLRWDFMFTGSLNANKDTKELPHKGDLESLPLLLDIHWLLASGRVSLDLIDCALWPSNM